MSVRLLLCTLLASFAAAGETFLTKEEALELAFPECEVTRSTLVLTEEQKARVTKLAGAEFGRSLVYPYVATRDGKVIGTAWFDVHRVRTLRETLMIVVDPDGKIARIEVLAFGEPAEYLPRASWYGQFVGRGLDDDLSLKKKKGISKVTGATLTARATLDAARRNLALQTVWLEAQPPPKPGEQEPKPKPAAKDNKRTPPRGGKQGSWAASRLATRSSALHAMRSSSWGLRPRFDHRRPPPLADGSAGTRIRWRLSSRGSARRRSMTRPRPCQSRRRPWCSRTPRQSAFQRLRSGS